MTPRPDDLGVGATGEMEYPLRGLRVLSLAEQYPGPFGTLILADLGADVVLVERPDGGDPSRRFPGFFEALNRNKRSVALDLKTLEGLEACLKLVDTSDVFIEGFRPGTMARLGLDYPRLLERRPQIVYVSISGFGQDGPYRNHPAHDLSYQGFSGLLSHLTGDDPPAPPEPPPLAVGDTTSGLFAAVAVLGGLMGRVSSGKGMHMDLSMLDALVSLTTAQTVPVINGTGAPGFPLEPGYGLFEAGDGRVLTLSIVHEDKFWQQLCAALELDEYEWLDHGQRLVQADAIRKRLTDRIKSRPAGEWLEEFRRLGVPSGPVYTIQEMAGDPHVMHRELLVEGPVEGGSRRFTRQPLLINGRRTTINRPAPELGEHTKELLSEAGLSDGMIQSITSHNDGVSIQGVREG